MVHIEGQEIAPAGGLGVIVARDWTGRRSDWPARRPLRAWRACRPRRKGAKTYRPREVPRCLEGGCASSEASSGPEGRGAALDVQDLLRIAAPGPGGR